jgi:hypothetical protein
LESGCFAGLGRVDNPTDGNIDKVKLLHIVLVHSLN